MKTNKTNKSKNKKLLIKHEPSVEVKILGVLQTISIRLNDLLFIERSVLAEKAIRYEQILTQVRLLNKTVAQLNHRLAVLTENESE